MEFGDYKVETDDLSVTVFKKQTLKKDTKKGKAGDIYWTPLAYFYNFENALKFLCDLEVKLTGFKDFETVVKKQAELYKMIEALKLGGK